MILEDFYSLNGSMTIILYQRKWEKFPKVKFLSRVELL